MTDQPGRTPRVDEAAFWIKHPDDPEQGLEVVCSLFAHQLEDELAAAQEALAETQRQLEHWSKGRRPFSDKHAQEVIAGQAKTIDELNKRLTEGWASRDEALRQERAALDAATDALRKAVGAQVLCERRAAEERAARERAEAERDAEASARKRNLAAAQSLADAGNAAEKRAAQAEAALADEKKLSAAISRDCNDTALERNELRAKLEQAEAQRDNAHRMLADTSAKLIQAEARANRMEVALLQFAGCDLNESNCASFAVANRRIRTLARAALAPAGGKTDGN